MPIRQVLDGQELDPATVSSMLDALIGACRTLGRRPGSDTSTHLLASKIIEQVRNGERDSERLKTAALRALQTD